MKNLTFEEFIHNYYGPSKSLEINESNASRIGVIIGSIGGFSLMFKLLKRLNKDNDK